MNYYSTSDDSDQELLDFLDFAPLKVIFCKNHTSLHKSFHTQRVRLNSDFIPSSNGAEELEAYGFSDVLPWEIFPSDIGSQLSLLGILPPHVGIDEGIYDQYSLNGSRINMIMDETPVGECNNQLTRTWLDFWYYQMAVWRGWVLLLTAW
jgi:hypothetical protein